MTPEAPPTESFWTEVTGERLAQGDYLLDCPVPVFPADYGQTEGNSEVGVRLVDLIVVTQSCDLENKKVSLVAMCPISTIAQLKTVDEKYGKNDRLEEIRKGKWEALHMLSSPESPTNNQDVRIVDFREIHSLPVQFLGAHAIKLGKRRRLKSPYLEHFSQAFARFFMRVGLPSAIQKFK
jgi:hypothetical protein